MLDLSASSVLHLARSVSIGVGSTITTPIPHSTFGGRTPDEVYATQASEEKLAA